MFGDVELLVFLYQPLRLGALSFPFSLVELLVEWVLPAVGVWLFLFITFRIVRRAILRVQPEDFHNKSVLKWTRRIFRLVALLVLFGLSVRLLGVELLRWVGIVARILSQPFYSAGNTEISIVTLALVVPIFYLAGWLARVSRRMVKRGVLKRMQLDRARQSSVLNAVQFGVMIVMIAIGLSIIGINLSSLAVLFGVLGIGVGFGLQDVVGNMFAGIVIIFARPVKEGDRILVDGIEGTVQQIKLIHTAVNTITHETIIIPNSEDHR